MVEHLLAIAAFSAALAGWALLQLWTGHTDPEPDPAPGERSCGTCTLCDPEDRGPAPNC